MINILLVCDYSPWDQHVGSRRWARFIPALATLGVSFNVLAPRWTVGQSCEEEKSLAESSVAVRRWDVVSPRVAAWQFRKRAPFVQSRGSNPVTTAFPPSVSALVIKRRVIRFINQYYFPDVSWHVTDNAVRTGLSAIEKSRPHLIIASHPFCGSLQIGFELSKRTGIPWVADMRDGWSTYHLSMFRSSTRLSTKLARFERTILDSASLVTSATTGVDRGLECSHNRRAVVYTGYAPAIFSDNSKAEESNNTLNLAIAGSVTEVHDTDTLLLGLKLFLQRQPLCCQINYYGNYFGALLLQAQRFDIPETSFTNRGFLPIEELLPALHKADCLVALGMKGTRGGAYASARIFDYFAAKRPILAASEYDNELTAMVGSIPGCFHCSTTESVATTLERIYQSKQTHGRLELNEAALKAIMKWSIEGQAVKMATALKANG